MRIHTRVSFAALTCALFLVAPAVEAQQPVGTVGNPSQIVVSGMGETRTTPDRAIINIGVYSRAVTAAAAARDNARKQSAIIDTLVALGFAREQISTTGYHVSPEMRHIPQSGRAEVIGYSVNNMVRIDVRRLDQIGPAIDAALAKGANQIHGLDFYVFNADEPRRRALAQAIERARLDAEVIARAAGGSLGVLLEISTSGAGPIPRHDLAMVRIAEAAAAAPTPIQPGEEVVRVAVVARWQFVPGGR
jgi:uncharacterized protein YggE